MRSDSNFARSSFRYSEEWNRSAQDAPLTPQIDRRLQGGQTEDGKYVVHSLSGKERNHFFANRGGKAFDNISALSGADSRADGRGFVLLDYDRDGWQDLAVVNANEPLFNLYRNQMGGLSEIGDNKAIAIRFVGGGRTAGSPAEGYACRDGYGAMVAADLGDLRIKRELRCGEGFSVQNSATMILGIGSRSEATSVTVRWPSGKSMTTKEVPAGTLLTVHENPGQSPDGGAFVRSDYPKLRQRECLPEVPFLPEFSLEEAPPPAKIRIYTTMATWCDACRSHIPQLCALKTGLAGDGVDLIGIAIDESDDAETLRSYCETWKPPYRILADLDVERRNAVSEFLTKQTGGVSVLPSTLITDERGRVLKVMTGVPDVSLVRKLAAGCRSGG